MKNITFSFAEQSLIYFLLRCCLEEHVRIDNLIQVLIVFCQFAEERWCRYEYLPPSALADICARPLKDYSVICLKALVT